MFRRTYLGAAALVGAALLAGCTTTARPVPVARRLSNPSFEDGMDGWTVGTHLPVDPNDPDGGPVATEVRASAVRASDGDRSLRLFIDGLQDDGTLWVQQSVDLTGVETVSVDVWSPFESFNTISKVAVYAGPDPGRPLTEADFDVVRAVEDHAGWHTHTYPVTEARDGLVAVGISVVWETELERGVDRVRLA
jgi:hypothetical protein